MINQTRRSQTAILRKRIKTFYDRVNAQAWSACYRFIDPRLLMKSDANNLYSYARSVSRFLSHHGTISIEEVSIQLYLDTPSRLYENRDFASVAIRCRDRHEVSHSFREVWVKEGKSWYTRVVGYVTPEKHENHVSRDAKVDE